MESVCSNLDKDSHEYPTRLKLCVCVIFKDESNDIIWSSFGSNDLNTLNSILKNRNFKTSNQTPLVDYAYGIHTEAHPIGLVLQQYYDYLMNSIKFYSRDRLSVMGATLKSSGLVDVDKATLEQKYLLLQSYLRQVCQPLLESKLLESVWTVIENMRNLTGSDYFSRRLLLEDDGTMRDLFVERGFCMSAHELDYKASHEQETKWIKPDE